MKKTNDIISDEALVAEQFATLVRHMPQLYSVLILVSIFFGISLKGLAPGIFIIGWVAVIVVTSVYRGLHWRRLQRNGYDLSVPEMRRELVRTNIIGIVLCMCFSGVGVFAARSLNMQLQGMTMMVAWGAAVAAAVYLVSLPVASRSMLYSSTLALTVVYALSGSWALFVTIPAVLAITFAIHSLLRTTFANFRDLVQSRAVIKAMHVEAREQALSDSLTGLPNRRRFDEAFRSCISRGGPFAVAMLDLDGFKQVNDVYGHAMGDRLLLAVAERLAHAMEQHGLVARMGGDEFAILLHAITGPEDASSLIDQAIVALDAPIALDGVMASVGTSAGLAIFTGEGPAGRLVEQADIALNRCKVHARGGKVVFSQEFELEAQRNAAIEQGLRLAVINQEFSVHFQPIFNLATGQVKGFEALARWSHPVLGPISPAHFIPIAERAGLIGVVSDCLLHMATRAAAQWPAHFILSFNLSAAQLVQPSAGLNILSVLAANGLRPAQFQAEVTETAIMADIGAATRTLGNLRAAGVRVALDDFGTGYSSFSHLSELPLDRLKIDRSFVAKILADERLANVVKTIIQMAANLKLECTAEGIEDEEQLNMLRAWGCQQGQGYLFSPAVPEAQLQPFITRADAAARKHA